MLTEPAYRVMVVFTAVTLLLGGIALTIRARYLSRARKETDRTESELSGQLVHAAKLASVGELAAGIAHEINNPLAIIAEETGMLMDLQDPQFGRTLTTEELNSRLDAIHSATFRCRDITQKLLSFVRQRGVKILPHDINEIVDEAADGLLGYELPLSHIEVVKRYGDDLPPVLTDQGQIVQVLINLMQNAVDAMESGGRLTLETRRRDGRVSVSVRDTGCGMTPEQLEHIFTPFYTTKPATKGTGLGLSVSLSIIKNLGGEFFVDSEPGVGSRFRFDLPTEKQSEKEDQPTLTEET
jgi:two-component system NtrC family sensor kinase